jgi:hypothetical protein
VDVGIPQAKALRLRRTLEPALMATTEGDPLIRAIGGALGIVGALLERAEIATIDEFASALSIYGAATRETAPDEAEIIAQWVLTLLELAAQQSGSN